jgi:DNA invertase Pin-like site-specific DNA recombinase
MEHALAYVRVSTNEQALEGISIEAQLQVIRDYARFRKLELVEELIDPGVSASKPLRERLGGAELFELAQQDHIKAIIAYKLDRLFRDAADCLTVTGQWDKLGVDLHLVDLGGQPIDTSTAMGRFFLTIMAGVAEMERNLIRERTKAAMAHLAATGKRVGGLSYGWGVGLDGKTLVRDVEEAAVVAKARQLHEQGLSLRRVAQELSAQGFQSRTGLPFHPQQISRMLISKL